MTQSNIKNLVLKNNWKPRSAVWELTLACNLRCGHCGSRAGHSLPDELSTKECFDLVEQLKELGCELITLSGGEPTLREDWADIARHIHEQGMYVNMVTNGVYGKHTSPTEVAQQALASGMCNVGVSIDGPKEIHNQIRGNGTYEKTTASIRAFREVGFSTTIMTTINRLNVDHIETMRQIAIDLQVNALRFQLAKPMGTMDDHRDWVIRPNEILTLMPRLAAMKQQGGVDIRLGDSLGYYGKPDKILRSWSWKRKRTRWGGCQAGMQAVGIQANGDIKGCLSMQAARGDRDPFVEGNIRQESLADIWYRKGAFSYNRNFTLDQLTHDCAKCKQATLCRGGARCISSAVDGTLTHDDYCYFRLLSEREQLNWTMVGKTAAAAAFAISMNTAACGDDNDPTPTPDASDLETDSESDSDTAADSDTATDSDTYSAEDYAVEPPETDSHITKDTDSYMLDYAVEPQPDYAAMPDSDTLPSVDYAVEPMPEYAVMPDSDTYSAEDYAVEPPPDTDTEAGTDTLSKDTEFAQPDYGVELDYGLLPDKK